VIFEEPWGTLSPTEANAVFKLMVFLLGSAVLIYISRASLRAPRSHGFYRFFAWECILALVLLNIDVWFQTPFAWYQLVSWLLLALCLIPLILGVRMLRPRGRPVAQRETEPQLRLSKRLPHWSPAASITISGIRCTVRCCC
jgi:hypothetical protein